MLNSQLAKLEEVIEYKFNNLNLLIRALTHRSYAFQRASIKNNERLEFLGDSVLSLIIAQILYDKFPNESEGKLSKLKSQTVSARNISSWARDINLGSFIFLGSNEKRQKIRDKDNLLCDAFEALLGAVFMDSGYESVKKIVQRFFDKHEFKEEDYKSKLQEIAQAQFKELPIYKITKEYGPQHNRKFEVIVHLKDKLLGAGIGQTKKEAQQIAAKKAMENIIKEKTNL